MLSCSAVRLATRSLRCQHGTSFIHTERASVSDPRWPGWEVVVGIEVHAQIKSRHKLFSAAQTSGYDQAPNTHVSTFDAAFPGTLPRLNPRCVDLAARAAIALGSTIQRHSSFDRKHYFYHDLPAGYQITQRYRPFAVGGQLDLAQSRTSVRIEQIQLEQDTAKTTFDARRKMTLVDLNRAGSALVEIVSRPDMRSPEEAGDYVKSLQALLRAIGSSDGNMEQGSLRCDVNVSVNRPGDPAGTRCEIKNLNSVKFMIVAITSEVLRHISIIQRGQAVAQETRGFDEDRSATFKLRSKEDAPDYRYMPDPNIPPLVIETGYIDRVRKEMPELPEKTRARLLERNLTDRDVTVLMTVDNQKEVSFDGEHSRGIIEYFDELAKEHDTKTVMNWLTHELLGQLARRGKSFHENSVSTKQMSGLIQMIKTGEITGDSGKVLLRHLLDNPSEEEARVLAQELSLVALQDDALHALCKEAISSSPSEVAAICGGNTKVINKLVGKVMKASRGTANAQSTLVILQDLLHS